MSKNIFQIWRDNGEIVPFNVRRDNWSEEFYTVVEKIEVKKWPYGNAYGYPTKNGVSSDHYNYSKSWRENKLIPCAGCYQWNLVQIGEKSFDIWKINKATNLKSFDLTSVLNFGKHKGEKLSEVYQNDPQYVFWCIKNISEFFVNLETVIQLEKQNKDVQFRTDLKKILEIKSNYSEKFKKSN